MKDSKHLRAILATIMLAGLNALEPPRAEANALEANARTRARLGLEAGVGWALGDTTGGAFNLSGQLGLQANDVFAIYWKPSMFVDGWARSDDLDIFLFTGQIAMFDLTASRWFQIGAGGGVDIGRFGLCEGSGNDTTCEMHSREVRPAAEGRLAFIIPLPGARARWGIPIVFNAHATFFSGQQIYSLTGGTGILRF